MSGVLDCFKSFLTWPAPKPADVIPIKPREDGPFAKQQVPHTVSEFEAVYRASKILESHRGELQSVCGAIYHNKEQYDKVEMATGVPWFLVGCLHEKEASLNFKTHLHNGDPLTHRTVQVPAGRPKFGSPPFSWYESAIDALGGQGAHKTETWGIGYCLWWAERYNGMGYSKRGLFSPYVWNYMDCMKDQKGHYVADGKFDPNGIPKNPGVAAMIKVLGLNL